MYFIFLFFRISQPLFIGEILVYFSPSSSGNIDSNHAYIYCCGLVLNLFLSMLLYHSTVLELLQCEMKMRVACSSLVFRKVWLSIDKKIVKHHCIWDKQRERRLTSQIDLAPKQESSIVNIIFNNLYCCIGFQNITRYLKHPNLRDRLPQHLLPKCRLQKYNNNNS